MEGNDNRTIAKAAKQYEHLFGPVVSRRYGRSLGVDLVRPKTCSFNCIFCQLGDTRETAITPRDDPPAGEILDELSRWLQSGESCDVITLAGSGEPTLHSGFGRILDYIRQHASTPSLLLSNGSLFFREDVRRQALGADIVKLSLHAWDQESFMRITRADRSLDFDSIVNGYRQFRSEFGGRIDLEVFVIPGINDTPGQMRRIASIAESFAPDSVFLNSAVRPPADASVRQVPEQQLKALSQLFGERAREIPAIAFNGGVPYSDDTLLQLVSRHPASINQLAQQFNISHDMLKERLAGLEKQRRLTLQKRDDETFVVAKDGF